jgi:hypothetical protein
MFFWEPQTEERTVAPWGINLNREGLITYNGQKSHSVKGADRHEKMDKPLLSIVPFISFPPRVRLDVQRTQDPMSQMRFLL